MGLLSNRYAKAWLDFATEKGKADEMYAGVKSLLVQLEMHPEILPVLENPAVNSEQKQQLLITAAGQASDVYARCITLLAENNRMGEVLWIARQFVVLYRKQNHLSEAIVTSASAVDDEVAKELKKWIEQELQGQVELHWKENPALIGGFILEVEGKRWDASIKNQLEVLRKNLSN